jgi:para-aminobenzoate synthetase
MTGAPKIKAIQLCSKLEKVKRGVYSGAIGWFGGDGSADLSVVIRTIIIDGNKFEFQVGGAIVADSEAESEFEESITKAKAVCAALDVDVEKLKRL